MVWKRFGKSGGGNSICCWWNIWMPRMNGLELLSCLPNAPPLKAVVMTADDTAETPLQALPEQAYQYIPKLVVDSASPRVMKVS